MIIVYAGTVVVSGLSSEDFNIVWTNIKKKKKNFTETFCVCVYKMDNIRERSIRIITSFE